MPTTDLTVAFGALVLLIVLLLLVLRSEWKEGVRFADWELDFICSRCRRTIRGRIPWNNHLQTCRGERG